MRAAPTCWTGAAMRCTLTAQRTHTLSWSGGWGRCARKCMPVCTRACVCVSRCIEQHRLALAQRPMRRGVRFDTTQPSLLFHTSCRAVCVPARSQDGRLVLRQRNVVVDLFTSLDRYLRENKVCGRRAWGAAECWGAVAPALLCARAAVPVRGRARGCMHACTPRGARVAALQRGTPPPEQRSTSRAALGTGRPLAQSFAAAALTQGRAAHAGAPWRCPAVEALTC